MNRIVKLLMLGMFGLLAMTAFAEDGEGDLPPLDADDPMAMMFLLFDDDFRATNFRTMDRFFPSVTVEAGGDMSDFAYDLRDLPETYTFDGETGEITEFLTRTETTSLIVLQDDAIRFEAYYQGWDDSSPATSWSVAKSFVSALVGIAVDEGLVDSIDDAITDYVPRLLGSGYEGVPIIDVLTMSSGVAFDENYDNPNADVNMIFIQMMGFERPIDDYITSLDSEREPGIYNNYVSSDTHALAMLLEAVTDTPLAELLEINIWQPLGMEADAFWSTDRHGQAIGFCCLNAVPRDYLRFGKLYLNEGQRDGVQIIPRQWVIDSVNPTAPHLQPGDNPDSFWTFGYGYQWWIPEQPQGDFVAIGVWGQYIYVDPARDIVIVKTSSDYFFDENDHETIAVFRAIAADFAGES
ncbi:MAG: class C beta-lactamase-related serine hydrolase [Anaerolineaceae bacterium]|nr:MAG: class C beta-lactamase-related serine hydrolase [Anaerolineaceae bacterium]